MMESRGRAASAQTVRDLNDLREAFLALHTLLLRLERASYEAEFGAASSGQMLKLVLEDERFAWLRKISELIVRIDVLLDEPEPLSRADARAVVEHSVSLINPAESATPFYQRYLAAMQDEPDVIFAHRGLREILARAGANLQ